MTTLRILISAPDAPGRASSWALYDAAGDCVQTGYGAANELPAADRIEVVIASSQVRLAAVALPPLPPGRVAAAAAFALEDQLANPADDPVLIASPQHSDGRVVVIVVGRSLLESVRAGGAESGSPGRVERAIAEPELARSDNGWCWCAPDDKALGDGFVRLVDGSAFPVSEAPQDGSLPAELRLALVHAERTASLPAHVRVDADVADETLARWQQETSVPFVRGEAWRWHAAAPAAFSAATNLLQGEFATTAATRTGSRARSFRAAAVIAAAALLLHIVATLGEWAWWRIDDWRTARAIKSLAVASGIAPADAATPQAARAAVARHYAEVRHSHALPAPSDALPLLARAAPALSGIPPGSLKSATYADGHWTLDLQRADAAMVGDLDARLRRAGAPASSAITATGARVRFGTD